MIVGRLYKDLVVTTWNNPGRHLTLGMARRDGRRLPRENRRDAVRSQWFLSLLPQFLFLIFFYLFVLSFSRTQKLLPKEWPLVLKKPC